MDRGYALTCVPEIQGSFGDVCQAMYDFRHHIGYGYLKIYLFVFFFQIFYLFVSLFVIFFNLMIITINQSLVFSYCK